MAYCPVRGITPRGPLSGKRAKTCFPTGNWRSIQEPVYRDNVALLAINGVAAPTKKIQGYLDPGQAR